MFCVNDYENTMVDCVENIESFKIFKNGIKTEISKQNKNFKAIIDFLKNIFISSRMMPAFSVSLHEETINELNKDSWLQINFDKQIQKNGLKFNALLFKLEKTSGTNLIRLHEGKFEGRCIYLDFDNEFNLELILNTLDNQEKQVKLLLVI